MMQKSESKTLNLFVVREIQTDIVIAFWGFSLKLSPGSFSCPMVILTAFPHVPLMDDVVPLIARPLLARPDWSYTVLPVNRSKP